MMRRSGSQPSRSSAPGARDEVTIPSAANSSDSRGVSALRRLLKSAQEAVPEIGPGGVPTR
ncbi:MAG: hypothetical protein IJ623_00165 [Bacteroidales bacterium]|nr:hypothetical protein [Bacteroidales bacterium]